MHFAPEQIRALRLRAQGLTGPRLATATAVVERLVGVQAQEEAAARLAIRPRSSVPSAAVVDEARLVQREIVYTWAMRSTLHFVSTADLPWLLGLLGPLFVRLGRRRRVQLDIDGEVGQRAMETIDAILAVEGPLTREELGETLAASAIPTEGQALYHLIGRAGLEGILCIGAPRGGRATYAPLADWAPLPAAGAGEQTVAALARRYLAGYGPVAPEDFASWSGLPLSQARSAFAANLKMLVAGILDGKPIWLLPEQTGWLDEQMAAEPTVHLLPGYDAYLLGYRSRALILDEEHARRVHPGGGVIRPALLVDGLVAGTWRLERRAAATKVVIEPFAPLARDIIALVETEVASLGRFLEQGTVLELAG
jgi:hypothetical protein